MLALHDHLPDSNSGSDTNTPVAHPKPRRSERAVQGPETKKWRHAQRAIHTANLTLERYKNYSSLKFSNNQVTQIQQSLSNLKQKQSVF